MCDGDVVIGVKSSGIHTNGLSLARKAFFADHRYAIDHKFDELSCTLGEPRLFATEQSVGASTKLPDDVPQVALLNAFCRCSDAITSACYSGPNRNYRDGLG